MFQGIKVALFGLIMALSLQVAAAGIDINQATAQQMAQGLNGIGLVKAEEIVRYRQINGPFQTVDQLVAVKGIGGVLLERNRDSLSVSVPEPVAAK